MATDLPKGSHAPSLELPLGGREVTRCLVDYAFSLQFYDVAGSFTLRIGNGFVLATRERDWKFPAEQPRDVGPALRLFKRTVTRAWVDGPGLLSIEFAGGERLEVQPDPQYEAWQLDGPGGLLIVSTPGGALAIWKSEAARP